MTIVIPFMKTLAIDRLSKPINYDFNFLKSIIINEQSISMDDEQNHNTKIRIPENVQKSFLNFISF